MGTRILLCGLAAGAFIVTLAFTSRHEGLWRTAAAPVHVPRAQPRQDAKRLVPGSAAAAETNSPPPVAAPEPMESAPQSGPYSRADADLEAERARTDRDGGHGSRTH